MADTIIENSYQNLKKGAGGTAGYIALDHYPSKDGMNFQAADFPLIAGSGEASMLGNNQAFFFVRNPRGNADPAKIEPDTSALKRLLENIYDKGTRFSLIIDAAVFRDRDTFVDKYQHMRPEADEAARRGMLRREAEMIADFVESGGIKNLARQVIREKSGITDDAMLDRATGDFLQHHFKLQGTTIRKPLDYAVWSVDGPGGALIGRQAYSAGTSNTERAWQLGTEPELALLKRAGHEGAKSLLEAQVRINQVPKINLTLGDLGQSAARERR